MDEADDIEQMETYRKRHISFLSGICVIIWIAILSAAYFFIILNGGEKMLLLYMFLGGFFISYWCFQMFNKDYRKRLKNTFMEALAKKHHFHYSLSGAFKVGDVYDHHLLPSYDVSHTEDGFFGSIKHVPFKFQEVHLQDIHRDSKGRTTRTTVFRGLMILLELKKFLSFHTIAMPANPARTWLKTNMSWRTRKFEKVGLPSKFENVYDVISTDQVESRVIFDPAFMERFLDLCEHINAKNISASFKDDELLIMASTNKNHFELGHLFKPLNTDDFTLVEEDLKIIADIVDVLKLNPHTGL